MSREMGNMNDNILRDAEHGVYTPLDYRAGQHAPRLYPVLDDMGAAGRRARAILGVQGLLIAAGATLVVWAILHVVSGAVS